MRRIFCDSRPNGASPCRGTRASRRAFTLVELMLALVIAAILAALAVYGVRRYVARAKSAEAFYNLGAIGRVVRIASSRIVAPDGVKNPAPGLCVTSTPVPSIVRSIRGAKYQPSTAPGEDYDGGDSVTGWRCLRFSIKEPQYYRYRYQTGGAPTAVDLPNRGRPPGVNAAHAWSASAQGDLDGDGAFSWFVLLGTITDGRQVIAAPAIHVQDPEE